MCRNKHAEQIVIVSTIYSICGEKTDSRRMADKKSKPTNGAGKKRLRRERGNE